MAVMRARFEKPLAALEALLVPSALASDKVDATIDEAVKRDSRGRLFALEGLLRIYDGIHSSLAPLLASMKRAEDAIGAYTERLEYLEYAVSVEAPAAATSALARRAD